MSDEEVEAEAQWGARRSARRSAADLIRDGSIEETNKCLSWKEHSVLERAIFTQKKVGSEMHSAYVESQKNLKE